jgi:hypothetical protein
MWRRNFQSAWDQYSFAGYIQRWSFNLRLIDEIVQKQTDGQIKVFSWGSNREGILRKKVTFDYYNNKEENEKSQTEWHEILTEKTHEEIAEIFINLARSVNATHICISGVSDGYFLDDTFLFIMQNQIK